MSKPAESRSANEARFDTELKDADGDFFISRWMNSGSIKDFVQGAFERPTSKLSLIQKAIWPIYRPN